MSLRRVRPWDFAVAILGVALWGLLGAQWYSFPEGGFSAYEAFGLTDVLLALGGLAAVSVLPATALAGRPAVALPFLVITVSLNTLLALLVLYRIANQPGRNAEVDVAAGAWLGLVCVLAIVYAAYRALRDQRAPGIEPGPEPRRMPAPEPVEPAHEPPQPAT